MKKIYYLQKHEVKLGDIIECNGIKTLVTEELIELNPELFVVKDTIIEKHKEKTLEDYENILFEIGNSMITSSGVVYFSVYGWLKDNEPKLYYAKILQLIADDLNDGRYIHIRGNTSYHLSNTRSVNVHCGGDEGCVYFKSRELAEKARSILGDKVNYLFN